jgi:cellulose synthase/poly-beta-1,6-N-acetylglucosamine synthase-like glycosyltransferase
VTGLALLILAALTSLLLAGAFVEFLIGNRSIRRLSAIRPSEDGPSISVVAAARNEGRAIEAAIGSLLRLDYPALEIVIVNDRSTDDTGAILARVERETRTGPRLRVVHITEVPEGWLGKNHALHVGAAAASGEFLLFTDADIVFEPTTLRRAVAYVLENRVDHLAAIPDVHVPGLALRAFIAAFAVFFSLYARPWKARDERSRAHIGIGAFNLIRASAYRAIGGHSAIAMRPDDDLKLGKVLKQHGFRQDVVNGQGFVVVEWYSTLRELVDGLMKNAFAGVDYSLLKTAGATAGLLVMNVWPFLAAMVTSGPTRALNALSVALIVLIFWTVNRDRLAYVIGYPFAAMLFAYIMWRSALLAVWNRTIVWRGTAYPLERMRANRV